MAHQGGTRPLHGGGGRGGATGGVQRHLRGFDGDTAGSVNHAGQDAAAIPQVVRPSAKGEGAAGRAEGRNQRGAGTR